MVCCNEEHYVLNGYYVWVSGNSYVLSEVSGLYGLVCSRASAVVAFNIKMSSALSNIY